MVSSLKTLIVCFDEIQASEELGDKNAECLDNGHLSESHVQAREMYQ